MIVLTKIEFRNYKGEYCAFTDDSVIFANNELKEARVFPVGSIKKLSARGGLRLVANNGETFYFSFLYMRKRIKTKIKNLVNAIKQEKTSAEPSNPYSIEIDENKKENILQIRRPHISKKRLIKFWGTVIMGIVSILIVVTLIIGLANEQTGADNYSEYGKETPTWNELWK